MNELENLRESKDINDQLELMDDNLGNISYKLQKLYDILNETILSPEEIKPISDNGVKITCLSELGNILRKYNSRLDFVDYRLREILERLEIKSFNKDDIKSE